MRVLSLLLRNNKKYDMVKLNKYKKKVYVFLNR